MVISIGIRTIKGRDKYMKMKTFIVKLLDSRPHQNLMEYKVEWNDGSIEWVTEQKMKEVKFE